MFCSFIDLYRNDLGTIFIFLIPNCSVFATVAGYFLKSTHQMVENHKIQNQASSMLLIKMYFNDLNS